MFGVSFGAGADTPTRSMMTNLKNGPRDSRDLLPTAWFTTFPEFGRRQLWQSIKDPDDSLHGGLMFDNIRAHFEGHGKDWGAQVCG